MYGPPPDRHQRRWPGKTAGFRTCKINRTGDARCRDRESAHGPWDNHGNRGPTALRQLAHLEGIIAALESAHAVAECIKRAPTISSSDVVIVNISGRGDKDIGILRENLAL